MKLINVNKSYNTSYGKLQILKNISVSFEKGKFYAIMGRSGSGKSTLVNILGLLDNFDDGDYYLNNTNVKQLNDKTKSRIRGLNIGFVFQSFYLNKNLTAYENIILPTYINDKMDDTKRKNRALNIMKKLEIIDRTEHKPSSLSGGEQQRVAIARALINNPDIIIADEPTGNLDSSNELEVLKILKEISKQGKIVIVVSHNPIIKNYADILYKINDGKISEEKI
jgi:ABC-type lipoprotein export system ATPase subunit